MVLPATPAVVPTVLPLIPVKPLAVVALVLTLRVLKLEEDRCRLEGRGWLGPDSKWFAPWSEVSGRPVDAEEAVEATESDCWRKSDSSRVRRFT